MLGKAAQAAASDIERLAPKHPVRRGQLTAAFQAVRKTLGILFADVGDTVKAGRTDAASAAMLSAYEWEEPYYRAAGIPARIRDRLRAGTRALSDRNVELMLRRFNTRQIPLSRQVYRTQALARGWVDEKINLGIGRGLTAREIARDVRTMIDPSVRGGVSYAAFRLGRTELNNAFHTAAIVSTADKPWVNGMQWKLSLTHPAEDICNELAEKDKFGMGEGIFPKLHVPNKPHPQCMCFVIPNLIDEDAFVDAFARGEYDTFLD